MSLDQGTLLAIAVLVAGFIARFVWLEIQAKTGAGKLPDIEKALSQARDTLSRIEGKMERVERLEQQVSALQARDRLVESVPRLELSLDNMRREVTELTTKVAVAEKIYLFRPDDK